MKLEPMEITVSKTTKHQRRANAFKIAGVILLTIHAAMTVYNSIMIREITKAVTRMINL